MMEAAVVIDRDGAPIHWHTPPGRTAGSLPDSRELWDVLWESRDRLAGVAHSHPGGGIPGPSHEDLTTFSAVELALGLRLDWWITSSDAIVVVRWRGPDRYDYVAEEVGVTPAWVERLRRL
jgi:hypothetical protein